MDKTISPHPLHYFICSSWNATYYGKLERYILVGALTHWCNTFSLKANKKQNILAIVDHIMPKCPDTNFEDFMIFLKENNEVKLHLKKSLLIRCDKQELNRIIYS